MANLIEVRSEVRSARAAKLVASLEQWGAAFLATLKLRDSVLSVVVVGDARMKALNSQWREKDKTTDVLSFPAGDAVGPGPAMLGDIAIRLPVAVRQAKALGTSVDEEARLYLAHGLLHLLGHDHLKPGEAKKMAAAEKKLLAQRGMLTR
ncbi:MAG: rRNA maturation RNase YbeY [Myxococcaceae bacterium]